MDWIIVSLASAAAFAIVSVLDKTILSKYVPHAPTFMFWTGLLQLPGAAVVLLVVPFESYSLRVVTTAYFSGFLWGISLVLLFWVLSKQEVSRVIPVFATSPVFVAILALLFLSEELTALHWVAILVTVAGAAFISFQRTGDAHPLGLGSSFFLLVLASALASGGQFLSKVALEDMTFWNMFAVRNVGLGMAAMLLPLRPSILWETRRLVRNPGRFGLLVLNEGPIAFLAVALTLWSISLGPVSLVVTIQSSRPLFVFILSVLLSVGAWRLLDEPLDRGTLAMKLASTMMIVGGVSAISLL